MLPYILCKMGYSFGFGNATSRAFQKSSAKLAPSRHRSSRNPTVSVKHLPMIRTCSLLLGLILAAASSPAAKLVLVAGGGTLDEGKATEVRLGAPFGAGFDKAGNMFVVEMTGQKVRKMDPQSFLTTVAGVGSKGDTGDGGPAAKAQFNGMHSLAVLPNGDILLADTWNNRLRKIEAKSGVI